MVIAGSFLAIQDNKEKIKLLDQAVDQIHFDIMDGIFTERPTLDLNIIKEGFNVEKDIDVHLMVVDVKKYVEDVLIFNPKYITFHIELLNNPDEYINYIKEKGIKVGIAINPETEIDEIYPYLDSIDLVLLMSVHPGKGGQSFIDISEKIEKLAEFRMRNDLSYIIEVDGGINNETISKVKSADAVVVGSYITNSDDYIEKVKVLRKCLNE